MFRTITLNALAAVCMTALVVSLGVVWASMVATAKANTPVAVADALDRTGANASCRSEGWPYYEQSCRFDLRRFDNDSAPVRLIALR
jgi:hypothetical protein